MQTSWHEYSRKVIGPYITRHTHCYIEFTVPVSFDVLSHFSKGFNQSFIPTLTHSSQTNDLQNIPICNNMCHVLSQLGIGVIARLT